MHLEGLSGSDSDGDTAMEAETGGLTRDEKVTILDLQSEELTNESKPSYDERRSTQTTKTVCVLTWTGTSWFENISLDSQEDTRHGEVLFDVEDELDRQRYVDKHRQFWRDWSAKHLGVVNDLSGGSEE